MSRFILCNTPKQTTAKPAPVATGTSIKTMLQAKTFNLARIIEWGISFDAYTPGTPISVELVETGTVFATVTACVDGDISKQGPGIADQSVASVVGLTLGTADTGYTASAEGTITDSRNLDAPLQITNVVAPFVKQFPLGREPIIQVGKAARIRVHAGSSVGCLCYMILEF